MAKSKEQTLIDDGGIRLRCAEPSKLKCPDCGDISHSPEEWERNGGTCPLGCDSSPQIICARCERLLDAPPLGDHPCHSLDVYREKAQVVFAEEMLAVKEVRERVERELVERERVERERAERERAERERVERERVERERVKRERERWIEILFLIGVASVAIAYGLGFIGLFWFAALSIALASVLSIITSVPISVLAPIIVVLIYILGFVVNRGWQFAQEGWELAYGNRQNRTAVETQQKEVAASTQLGNLGNLKSGSVQSQKDDAKDAKRLEEEKKKAEWAAALRKIKFTAKNELNFHQVHQSFRSELRRGYGPSSNVLEMIANGAGFLVADADLDDDGVPEVVIRNPNCRSDGECDIYVVKKVPELGYKHISLHRFEGSIGVTNEKICGFHALFDASKAVAGSIRAEPMNDLGRHLLLNIHCGPGDANFFSPSSKLVTTQSSSDLAEIVESSLSIYRLANVGPHLSKIIASEIIGAEDLIDQEITAIQEMTRPGKGERKAARAANASGLAAMQTNSFDDAVRYFASGVKSDPTDREIIDNLANALLQSRRIKAAKDAATASLFLSPKRTSAWVVLAAIEAENGNEEIAAASFQLAYRFSRNREKTVEYLETVRRENGSTRVKEAASKALIAIRSN